MKKYNSYTKYLIFLIAAMIMSGCQDLNEDTSLVLVADGFYKTKEDVNAGITGVYASLLHTANGISNHHYFAAEQGTDAVTTKPDANKAPYRELDRFQVTPVNGWLYDVNWEYIYRGIFFANSFLANYDRADAPQTFKDQAKAQVLFVRAWCYFRLVRMFGDVPFLTEPVIDTDLQRTNYREIYDHIIDDLKYCETTLPDTWGSEYIRPTKWAAKTMLAEIYLTLAGWPAKEQDKYALAAQKAKEVIDSGKFSLMEKFGDYFKIENSNNKETVYAWQFCYECGEDYANRLSGRNFNPNEDQGVGDYVAEFKFFNKFPASPRKDATYFLEIVTKDAAGNVISKTPYTKWNKEYGHPMFAKWRSGTLTNGDGVDLALSSRPITVYRYAQVLTMYAEAQCMADGAPNAMAYECINKIRRRAMSLNYNTANSDVDLQPGLSNIAFRDSVIQENAWEFAAEGVRWYDLVRTEKVAEANADKDPRDLQPLRDINTLPKEYYYLFPIPQFELDKNPNLTQNEGYY